MGTYQKEQKVASTLISRITEKNLALRRPHLTRINLMNL